jgi:hypothetical protein
MSAFVLENGVVYRAYPSYSHGVGALWGIYQWLDRAFKGRNETSVWWRRAPRSSSSLTEVGRPEEAGIESATPCSSGSDGETIH